MHIPETQLAAVLDLVQVESIALAQLHVRWAARTGVLPDPQVERSSREIVRLIGRGRRLRLLVGGKVDLEAA